MKWKGKNRADKTETVKKDTATKKIQIKRKWKQKKRKENGGIRRSRLI